MSLTRIAKNANVVIVEKTGKVRCVISLGKDVVDIVRPNSNPTFVIQGNIGGAWKYKDSDELILWLDEKLDGISDPVHEVETFFGLRAIQRKCGEFSWYLCIGVINFKDLDFLKRKK